MPSGPRSGEVKDMQIGVDADGGALVPEKIASPIIERALAQSRLASIVKNFVLIAVLLRLCPR